jgi:hypothetical protein
VKNSITIPNLSIKQIDNLAKYIDKYRIASNNIMQIEHAINNIACEIKSRSNATFDFNFRNGGDYLPIPVVDDDFLKDIKCALDLLRIRTIARQADLSVCISHAVEDVVQNQG